MSSLVRRNSLPFSLAWAALLTYAGCHSTGEPVGSAAIKESFVAPFAFGFGRIATQPEIDKWDIDVRPDGKGLPAGSGDAAAGKALYTAKCAACHGTGNEPANVRLPAALLFRKPSTAPTTTRFRTIGNYWPYASTLFDYTRRAMPFNAPGSLSNEEVYAVTAYILFENQVIDTATVLNATTLPEIRMPAQPLFVPDDRKGGPEIK